MASSVFYKWASRKDESRVTFDGTGISVFDMKREIILANHMSKANDFDLYIYDATSKQEYQDDSFFIPRSSSVIVKRLPAARQGKGKASYYANGAGPSLPTSEAVSRGAGVPTWHKGAMSKRFDGKDEPQTSSATPTPKPATPITVATNVTKEDEAAAMAAMFQAQSQNWEEAQEKMSHAQMIHRNPRGTGFGGRGGKTFMPANDKPLPPSYVCYRCGQKGHWIQDCPTNSDREFDHRPRIKRTTGIPRSMLKAVENPNGAGELGQGIMVTPEGGYVVAQPDLASWQKQVARVKGVTAAEVREKAPTDPALACPIDNKLFRDAVKTPCCGAAYCEECIQTHLLERDFICPSCGKKIASLDKLLLDKPMRTKVADYIEKAIEESKKAGGEDGQGEGSRQESLGPEEGAGAEQDLYSENQPDLNFDMSQMVVEQIPQIQAQIAQISQALLNPNLPPDVRHQTEMQHQHLQMQLNQAQTVQAALAVASFQQQQQQQVVAAQQATMAAIQQGGGGASGGGFNQMGGVGGFGQFSGQQQQGNGQDSAYQRLPVNNRRRNLKRERPSDFFDGNATDASKLPRYWE
ncbi:DWNN domain-containing protein [Crepidotus variabilis]|uniref:DWNN domain-containing protein n=1 Tax=Crepidotus variabilis TaxID=179855 RepID=A0A9P6EJX5_9AGAR|nr:DWNN domain-containing protein [Crepidotus variabilis]